MKPNGFVSSDPTNQPTDKVIRTRSRFPSLSYHFYNTERFGEYDPCFVMDCLEGDKVPIRSGGRVNSYSLKAPLLQSITKKKDFFMVPMEAILPINWQKFYTNPVVGDDVSDDVGTTVVDFWRSVFSLASNLFTNVNVYLQQSSPDPLNIANAVARSMVLLEYFYSSGSLIKSLGASGNRFCRFTSNGKTYSFDSWFDAVCSVFVNDFSNFDFVHDGINFHVINDYNSVGYLNTANATCSFRTFLQYLRDDLAGTYISALPSAATGSIVAGYFAPFFDSNVWGRVFHNPAAGSGLDYDLRRLWAYQLVCSHFYSNDHIDYIYSADLFRSLISFFVNTDSSGNYSPDTFTYNGVKYEYDYLSAHNFSKVLTAFFAASYQCLAVTNGTGAVNDYRRNLLAYFSSLFAYRRSLRYVDYFTGSRSRPLAVGSVDVQVNSNLVNVVDISRNIQRQRFFNAVNRFGRRFEEYIKGLSGVVPDTDYHNPLYLAHTGDTVYGVEVENTGAAQQSQGNSVTSRFQTNGSRYQFEFDVDRPCVVIGLSSYDIPRAYCAATERQLFHVNRFDMFNPFMQFIGDQAVSFGEIGASYVVVTNPTFGYQLRHMEYKQRFDQCAGGFIDDLPGFLFTDKDFGALGYSNINPDFIRSLNSELDQFYVALTGYSLGHYFHFIVDNDNVCDASRPMAFAPSIL